MHYYRSVADICAGQSYQYLALVRNFCPECGIQMTSTLADPDHDFAGVMALNVRAFSGMSYDKIKIIYVDMKDEPPEYDVDNIPTEGS